MHTGAGQRLYELLRNNGDVDPAVYQSLVGNMQANCGLSAEQAQTVRDYLLEMIDLTNPRNTQTPPVPARPPGPGVIWAPAYNAPAVLVSQKNVLVNTRTFLFHGT